MALIETVSLSERLRTRTAEIGFIGLGYVGLPEALLFARAGYRVTGFDVDRARVAAVREGRSYLGDVAADELATMVASGRLTATEDFARLSDMDAILICVPTPLSKTKAPDLSYILAAVDTIRPRLRPGQLIVLESTTYPGTTREVLLPALESTGLTVGRDVYLCFSPERINPGDRDHPPARIPKVLGGVTAACTEMGRRLYADVVPRLVLVSSPDAAEMVKLLENTFRAVNIALANELALMCRALSLDVWEVIDAAATKPFGFMPFYPGPGLGGHCIPIDPLYLGWKARVNGFEPRFIDLAHQVNAGMPRVVVSLVADVLNRQARSVNGASVLVLGVAYKRDVHDVRESPVLSLLEELLARGARVSYHDPYVPVLDVGGRVLASVPLDDATLADASCVVIATDHTSIDYARVVARARAVVDTRNATRGVAHADARVVRL